MRKEAVRAIAASVGANDAEELLDKLGEASHFREASFGFCLECGYQQPNVEPDVNNMKCDECGALHVSGLESTQAIAFMMHEDKINEWMRPEKGILRKRIEENRDEQKA